MGIAIIIPDLDFSESNIGQITMTDDLVSLSIDITSGSTITDTGHQCNVIYNPLTTSDSQKGVTWAVTSGDTYASIDSNGYLTINLNASNSDVTVRATSTYNSSIYAEVSFKVTFAATAAVFTDTKMYNFTQGRYTGSTMTDNWHSTDGIDVENATTFNYKTTSSVGDGYNNFSSVLFFSSSNVATNAMGAGTTQTSNGTFSVSIPTGAVRAVIMNRGTTEGVSYWIDD